MDALGHTLTSHARWVALQISENRRTKLMAKLELIERRGFRSREPSQLGGELNFVDQATHGRCGRAFTVMIQQAKLQSAKPLAQQALAYAGVQWWQTLLQHPVPRWEVAGQRRRRAALFPDGYWNPDKAEGGVGALLLVEGARALATGAVVPQHLAAQLLAIEDGRVGARAQRNTQAELLAVLVALLTWSEDLRGCELVIFDDSQAAEGNLLSGSATTAHSKELFGTIWLEAATR